MSYGKRGNKLADKIIKHYQSHGVPIDITDFDISDERYIFPVTLLRGAKADKIFKHARDIQLSLRLPLFQPVQNNISIFIVVSEQKVAKNSLVKILTNPIFSESKKKIPFVLGYDAMGNMIVEDLSQLIHLLIGGSSGSGKSTLLHSLLMSIVLKQPVSRVNILVFDIGASDLTLFSKVPHHPIQLSRMQRQDLEL